MCLSGVIESFLQVSIRFVTSSRVLDCVILSVVEDLTQLKV